MVHPRKLCHFNFISDKFKRFCKNLKMEVAVSSLYPHQSNGQLKTGIKFIQHTIKKSIDIESHMHIALLQIRSNLPGLPSPAMLLFNHPI